MIRPSKHSLAGPMILVPQHFGSTVYDRRTSRYLPFEHEATSIFQALACEPLDALIQTTRAQERKQVLELFHRYNNLGFFTLGRLFDGHVLPIVPPREHLSGPLAVHLEVTRRCSLRCAHCFAGSPENTSTACELTLSELDHLFGELAGCGAFRLGITGGEPLMRQDLIEIIEMAYSHGLSPCLTTNGTLMTDELARRLSHCHLAWLNVSFDGATRSTNDAVRGEGSFDQAMSGVRLLRRHMPLTLAFTVLRTNLHELTECAALARDVGAQAAVFRPLYPAGRGKVRQDLQPTFSEYLRAIGALRKLGQRVEADFCDAQAFGPLLRATKQSNVCHQFGCGAGNTVCSISAEGYVSPCSFLGVAAPDESLRGASFAQLWHHGRSFTAIRNLSGCEKCTTCANFDGCGGGCRARALAWAQADVWNQPDPWCLAEVESAERSWENPHGR